MRDSGFKPGLAIRLTVTFYPPPPPGQDPTPRPVVIRTYTVPAGRSLRPGPLPRGVYQVAASQTGTTSVGAAFRVLPPAG